MESEYHTHKSVQKGRGAIPVLYRVLVEGSTTVYASARILKVFFLEYVYCRPPFIINIV